MRVINCSFRNLTFPIIDFLKLELSENIEIVSSEFMNQATKIWDNWHYEIYPNAKYERHPISLLMEEKKFLAQLLEITR